MLILLGVDATAGACQRLTRRIAGRSEPTDECVIVDSHPHVHSYGAHPNRHMHVHGAGAQHAAAAGVCHEHVLAAAPTRVALRQPLLRAFGVGLVHELAGSAAIALLIVSAIPQPFWATPYLVIFCFGTIVGMGLITTAIATLFMIAAERMSRFHQGLVAGSGLLSFGFGLFLAYQLGIDDRLLGVAPVWTPC